MKQTGSVVTSRSPSEDGVKSRATLLQSRQDWTDLLAKAPYDPILYLQRAAVHTDLGYPDLAAGDAYRALLLTDEVRQKGFEYHEQACQLVQKYCGQPLPEVLRHGMLQDETAGMVNDCSPRAPEMYHEIAALASIRCFQMLALSLLLCGCLQSAYTFCERGLASVPHNADLLEIKGYIEQMASRRLRPANGEFDVGVLPDRGLVRREIYPWNNHEPDRFSDQSLKFLNGELAQIAPKCAVHVSTLPVLLDGASNTDGYDIIPTCNQLGLFAAKDIAPGEIVLKEYSLLTANNRLKETTCDACGSELPPLGRDSRAASCPMCDDTVFCDEYCLEKAQELYHPAVCSKDVDSIAKDPEAQDADESLYLLLLGRLLAMAEHQGLHPLDLNQIKYLWGDFISSESNALDLSPNAGPPPEWTLPFSFKYNIELPLHMLEKMDIDIYATLTKHDLWVFNTAYSKFRGTASARKNFRDGRPDVAAVHPFWCLVNHDCNPNVTWEWAGRMHVWGRETRVMGNESGGIKAGEEILNHYCDVDLPVQQRREWAKGSLGGWCMCLRCRNESAVSAPAPAQS